MAEKQSTTPLMEQYLSIKNKHKDSILFFRMGDFYEMFYEDAKTGSKVLGITLTSRSHGKSAHVPLAGFPHHALDGYLAKMIKAGYRVAICEQIEDPKLTKTIVKREVQEIITPGTAVSDDLLETKKNNYLASLFFNKNMCGFSVIDVSTGEYQLTEIDIKYVKETVLNFSPAEVLVGENQYSQFLDLFPTHVPFTITKRDDWTFNYDYAYESLTKHFSTLTLKGFGVEDFTNGISAAGAILTYLNENQKQKLVHINQLSRMSDSDYLIIDYTTRRNLELIQAMNTAGHKGTLLSVLDQTHTPMGARLLVNWLLSPLKDLEKINNRLDSVEELYNNADLRKDLEVLKKAGDLERLLAKFATGRANARDAKAIQNTLTVIATVKETLTNVKSNLLAELNSQLDALTKLKDRIDSCIVDNPPLSITDGGLIKRGFNKELDEIREIAYSGKDWIAKLQTSEREKTGISSLKVSFNKVFGYYIEITRPHLSKVPPHYVRKQTLVNSERFIVQELKEYEEKVLGAEEKIFTLEYELFNKIRQDILEDALTIQKNARVLAKIDCLNNLARVAIENDYIRPDVHNDDYIEIHEGRHPVVEKLLPPGEQFVVNDTFIDNKADQVLIITGPNMAGKSTYLRQIGLICIMAQMGGYIPAKKAKIGIIDRVFTRVGASDNLAAGESTFLTEMNETANILNNATLNSLIILDEIGRGTSTFDGLSIAWSVVEYIHNTPHLAAKTVFATHYHELTELELILPRVKNYNVAVKEWGDHIVFLRKIVTGGCDHSYGIHVAQLAGLPKPVINRAYEVLSNLESEALNQKKEPKLAEHRDTQSDKIQQMSLFEELEKSLREEINNIDPNKLTPIEALNKLDQLKQLVSNENKN